MDQIHERTPMLDRHAPTFRFARQRCTNNRCVTVGTRLDVWRASFTDEVQKLAGKSGQSAHVSIGLSEQLPRLREELVRGMTSRIGLF
jgi:hypothetical protein